MNFHYHNADKRILILPADGELNRKEGQEVVDQVVGLIEAGLTRIIVDCSGIQYVNSIGLRHLLTLHQRMVNAAGELKICGACNAVARLLDLTDLSSLIKVHTDLISASESFTAAPPSQ